MSCAIHVPKKDQQVEVALFHTGSSLLVIPQGNLVSSACPFIQLILSGFPKEQPLQHPGTLPSTFHVLPLGLEKWWFVLEVTSLSAAQWVWTTLPFGYLTKAGSQKGVWHTWQSFLSDRTVVFPFSFTCMAGENEKHHCKLTHELTQA